MILQYIPIANINVVDDSFRLTYRPRIDELICSIKKIGVVQPIILRHTPDGAYQIVSGYKRVLACQEINRQTIQTIIYEHTDLSPMQAFQHNLHENVFTRKLNIFEMSIALNKLKDFYGVSEEDLVKQYLPLMGEEPSYKVLHQLLVVGSINEPMKDHILASGVALSSAARISEFSPTTQNELLKVLKPIRPNTNKLNELLSLIREISARDGLSVEDILQRYQLLQIVADPNAAAPAKLVALRQSLRGIRLPQIVKRQQEWAQLLSSLELPEQAKLISDPYFEDAQFKLEYQFKAPEELGALIEKLNAAFERQQWHKIFDWYKA